jgi:hypothetical protein
LRTADVGDGDSGPPERDKAALYLALTQLAEQYPLINVRQDDPRQEISVVAGPSVTGMQLSVRVAVSVPVAVGPVAQVV